MLFNRQQTSLFAKRGARDQVIESERTDNLITQCTNQHDFLGNTFWKARLNVSLLLVAHIASPAEFPVISFALSQRESYAPS